MRKREAARDDLRATADAAARDAERIAALEREKLRKDPDDPAVAELSSESAEIGERLAALLETEKAVAEELAPDPE